MTLFLILLILILLILTLSWFVYRKVFTFDRTRYMNPYGFPKGEQYESQYDLMRKMVDAVVDIPYEDVEIKSWDNLTLHGKLYFQSKDAPIEILFHGYHGNGIVDFCGGLKLALDSGNNALLIDERAHGKSEGKCLTFGILERRDVLSWSKWAVERFGADTKIVLVGISMGAATVLMASDLEFPKNVKGIVADCGYTSPREIITKVAKDINVPSAPLMPFLKLGAKIYGGFDLDEISAPKALSRTNLPVMLIHGDDDRFVPCCMSQENYDACISKKYLYIFEGAAHGLSYLEDKPRYVKVHEDFLKEILQ